MWRRMVQVSDAVQASVELQPRNAEVVWADIFEILQRAALAIECVDEELNLRGISDGALEGPHVHTRPHRDVTGTRIERHTERTAEDAASLCVARSLLKDGGSKVGEAKLLWSEEPRISLLNVVEENPWKMPNVMGSGGSGSSGQDPTTGPLGVVMPSTGFGGSCTMQNTTAGPFGTPSPAPFGGVLARKAGAEVDERRGSSTSIGASGARGGGIREALVLGLGPFGSGTF